MRLPLLLKHFGVQVNQLPHAFELLSRESVGVIHDYRIEPVFGGSVSFFYVNVRRLVVFVAIKEEAKSFYGENGRPLFRKPA